MTRLGSTPISRRTFGLGLGVAGAVAVGACAPSSGSSAPQPATTTAARTDIAGDAPVTLKFLDFSEGNDAKYMLTAIAGFQAKYPNVKIARTAQSFDQVMSTLNLRLADKNGPDVATINNGWQSMGTLAKGNLIRNLDGYAEAYGWRQQIPATLLREHLFTTDGKIMGEGSLFGTTGARLTTVGLYYNTKLLAATGIAPPDSLAAFEAACAKIRSGGGVPIVAGTQEKTFATNPLFAVQAMLGSKKAIADFVYKTADVSLADTGMLASAEKLRQWASAGYFNADAAGLDFESGRTAFLKGRGIFHFDYSGACAQPGVDATSFARLQFPQADGGGRVAVGAASAVFAISARTPYPDAAAAFLDFLQSAPMNQLAVDSGMLPIDSTGVTAPSGTVFGSEVAQTNDVIADDGFVPFFDWASPNMLEIVGGRTQLLLAGRATPAQLISAGQADYDQFHATA